MNGIRPHRYQPMTREEYLGLLRRSPLFGRPDVERAWMQAALRGRLYDQDGFAAGWDAAREGGQPGAPG